MARLATELLQDLSRTRDEGDRELFGLLAEAIGDQGVSLPPMPETALRVQRLMEDPDCGVPDLAAAVERDPALSSRILSVANGAFYRGLEPVHALEDAIVRMGLRDARNAVFAAALQARVFRAPGFEKEVEALWQHVQLCAAVAQELAAEAGEDPDLGFLGGLLHDVGRAVILSFAGDVRRRSRGRRKVRSATLERLLGSLHAALGARLAQGWALPAHLAEAIAVHHDPSESGPTCERLARVLALADRFAYEAVDEAAEAPETDVVAELASLGLGPEVADRMRETVAEARERKD